MQVRATTDEGTSGWSASGSGSTDANAAPAFTSAATFDAAENQTAVGTVVASDSDADDSVTGYAIQGGADRSKFSIVETTGVLTFASAPNFEAPADADADNAYVVVVRAASGTGARAKTADQTITVTVTDVAGETPGVPAAPMVSAASVTSVTAAWTAPANAGPPITDYDYRYRVTSPQGSWTEVTTTAITALSATITGLAEDTGYDVQVRATTDEGTSGWSASGSGSTDANAAPAFTSAATFDAAENQTAVGTVVASDSDADDSVTGYAIQGGADRSKFSIVDTTGVLTFASAPNFEAPADADADNAYVVVVRAASGTGARAKTADQTITVTVTDVAGETPGVPAAPMVSAASVTSVTAAWTAPANAGPPITDYDYRYRVTSPQGSWTEVTTTAITALSATITGLAEDTGYDVQVRATTDEGTSGWSASGSGSTDANAAPAFTSAATFDAAENQTAVGTVVASDSDADDSVTGYAIQGGADRSKFSIVETTGVLTFASAPNFEAPADADADNAYVVVVRAASGTGARAKTADQTITVTVTDVAGETPSVPELSFAPNIVTVNEDAVSATLTVELDPASTGTVTVDYATRDGAGAAKAGEDYTATSGTLTFAATETSKTFTVPILDDDVYENNESFHVDLTNPTGATLASGATVRIDSEDAVPTASMEDVTVDEGAGTMTLTLQLSHPSQSDITYLTISNNVTGTATEGDDYDDFLLSGGRTARITVPGGDLFQTFDITIVDDSVDEPDETIDIGWQKSADDEAIPINFTFTGTITDNDTAGVTVSETALTVEEQDSSGNTYTVVLDSEPTASVTVTIAGHSGTDVSLVTSNSTPATLVFTTGNWSTAQTVTVTAATDANTADETINLTHAATSTDSDYGGITIAGVTVTVQDNDTAKVTGLMLTPGDGELVVAWTAVPNATGYEVQWKSGGESYNNTRGAVISSGSTVSHTIPSLTNGTTYTVRMRATRTGANDGLYSDEAMDAPVAPLICGSGDPWCATLTVQSLTGGDHFGCTNNQSGNECSDHLTEDEFTHASTDYSVNRVQVRANGQLQLFVGPNLARGSRALVLHVGSETFKFADADNKSGSNRKWNSSGLTWTSGGTVALKLTEAANSAATGTPSISGTAQVGQELTAAKGTITDTDGTTRADAGNTGYAYSYQWVRVDADGVSNPTDITGETSSTYTPVAADVGKKVKAKVSFLDDGDALETRTSAAYPSGATITAAPTVTLVLEPSSITEDGGIARVKATLDHPSTVDTNVYVTVTPLGTAVAGDFVRNSNNRLRIVAGETESRTTSIVTITAVDNDIYTGDKSLSVTGTATNDLAINPPQPVTLTIEEDDTAVASVTVSETALTVTEEDTTGETYTVVLDGAPASSVTIAVGGTTGTDVTATPASLTFTTTNWNTARTVTVTAGNDTDTVDDTVSLTHTATSTDTGYGGITIAGVTVEVEDNDTAKVTGLMLTPGDGELVVAWTAVPNATGYEVQWKSGGESYNNTRGAVISSGSTASHTIPSLTNGTTYTVRVRATRTDANPGAYSDDAMDAPVATASDDAKLGDLAVNDGTNDLDLTPPFASGTFAYEADVANAVDEVTLTATLSHAGASVSAVTLNGTGIVDSDFTDGIAVPSLLVGDNEIVVTVTAQDDATTQPYTLTLARAEAIAVTVSFEHGTYTVAEGGTEDVKVKLSADPERTVTIALTATGQDGADADDYSVGSSAVTFNSGEMEKTFSFTAIQDSVDDDGESVKLGFLNLPTGVTAGSTSEATVSITDDDLPPAVQVPGDVSVTEGAGTAQVAVGLSAASGKTVTVDWATADDSAVAGSDYTAASGTLTFDPGVTSMTITVAILDDGVPEPQESLDVILSNAANATLPAHATVAVIIGNDDGTAATGKPAISGTAHARETLTASTGTIMDDDGLINVAYRYQWIRVAGSVETDISGETGSTYVVRTADVGNKVKVAVSFTDDAGNAEALTSDAWPQSGTIGALIPLEVGWEIINYSYAEDEESPEIAMVLHSGAPVGNASIAADLVLVPITANDDPADGNQDYVWGVESTPLVIPPGGTRAVYTVQFLDDDLVENIERFRTELSNVRFVPEAGAVLDPVLTVTLSPSEGQVTIFDNDITTTYLEHESIDVGEGVGSVEIRQILGPKQVEYSFTSIHLTQEGEAKNGPDFDGYSRMVIFEALATYGSTWLEVVDDDLPEGYGNLNDLDFSVEALSVTLLRNGVDPDDVTILNSRTQVNIRDDDPAFYVPSGIEGKGAVDVPIKLSYPVPREVSIDYRVMSGETAVVSGTAVFPMAAPNPSWPCLRPWASRTGSCCPARVREGSTTLGPRTVGRADRGRVRVRGFDCRRCRAERAGADRPGRRQRRLRPGAGLRCRRRHLHRGRSQRRGRRRAVGDRIRFRRLGLDRERRRHRHGR